MHRAVKYTLTAEIKIKCLFTLISAVTIILYPKFYCFWHPFQCMRVHRLLEKTTPLYLFSCTSIISTFEYTSAPPSLTSTYSPNSQNGFTIAVNVRDCYQVTIILVAMLTIPQFINSVTNLIQQYFPHPPRRDPPSRSFMPSEQH